MGTKLTTGLATAAVVALVAVIYLVYGSFDGPSDSPAPQGPAVVAAPEQGPAAPAAAPAMPGAAGDLSEAQKAAIGTVVRDYLMAHPEVIREAMTALEERRMAEESSQQKRALTENREKLFSAANQIVLGNPEGDVTLVEFFDYNCSYCRRGHADMKRIIAEDPKLRWVLKEFPVLGPGSVEAAQVAIALWNVAPEKYGAFHDKLLTDRGQASGERAIAVARSIGVDEARLREAAKQEAVGKTIEEVYSVANSLGLTGTPTYVVGDEVVVGAVGYDALKAKIDAVRACGSTSC